MSENSTQQAINVRAAVNEWISSAFPEHRRFLISEQPVYSQQESCWHVNLRAAEEGCATLGVVRMSSSEPTFVVDAPSIQRVVSLLEYSQRKNVNLNGSPKNIVTDDIRFIYGDGISGASEMQDNSVDLLLTDPPYGISKSYTCEKQIPRRLRNNGSDFIMPRGFFGEWDAVDPPKWTSAVLPKVDGWAVIFCAHAQIGEYTEILRDLDFVAVGTLVWHKTNPVPFNHRFKPINAWEALVVGKRPGTPFNGSSVHNVFKEKSPSPQERLHPNQKPLPLIERFVELFSSEGDLVFDPFSGSGTTVVASVNKKRRVVSYENDLEIFNSARSRIIGSLQQPVLM